MQKRLHVSSYAIAGKNEPELAVVCPEKYVAWMELLAGCKAIPLVSKNNLVLGFKVGQKFPMLKPNGYDLGLVRFNIRLV